MKRRGIRRWALVGAVTAVALAGLAAAALDQFEYSVFDKRFYLSSQQIAFVRPGLELDVQEVQLAPDRSLSVLFKITDNRGLPLDLDGIFTPGPVRVRFVLGTIPNDGEQYVSYINRAVTSPITGVTAIQPVTDTGGSFARVDDGTYLYTFGARFPEGFDPDATHSVGIFADRDLGEFGLGFQIANEVTHFVPSGQPISRIRDVTPTESCNACHDPMHAHGVFRQEVQLCVMCHTTGVIDPDTGADMDFKVMVHKIHRGADLPSVQAGTPYQVIGFGGTVFDFSDVAFPQDIRNCESCHSAPAVQEFAHLLNPTRAACGSCHDDVNFATGEGHIGGPAISDRFCGNCHFPEGELEFDSSIRGAHTIPSMSAQLTGLNIEILEVQNGTPGDRPTVLFTIRDNEGEFIPISTVNSMSMVLAGPTSDYRFRRSEAALARATPVGDDAYSFTFDNAIPEDMPGSFVVAAEGFRNAILNPGTTKERSVREASPNPLFYFSLDGSEPEPRREIVSNMNCNTCHLDLNLHGQQRRDPEYCIVCHNPEADDSFRRPADQAPPRSIDFKFMVHRIHSGQDLTQDYTLFGFGNVAHNYNDLRYPGDLRNCSKCHEGDTYNIPSAGIVATIEPNEFFSPIPPNSAACLGCHDTLGAAAHAFVNIAPFGEACSACHASDREFSVTRVHAR